MSGIVAFDDLFPLKANPTTLDRVFGFDSGDGKSRGFTIQAILDLIAETPVTWTEISGRPTVFAPAAHSLGSHSNVASGVDSATDGTFLRRVGGSWQAVTVDFYGVTNPPPADATVPDAVRGITAAQITQWNTAFGWGNHAGQYRPISYVPSWAEITGKPSTFAPSGHTLASHSDAAALASAVQGQVIRKAEIGWEVYTPDYYSPFNPPPPDASIPDFVRDFTPGQFAGYDQKLQEWVGLPNGAIPAILGGVPVSSEIVGTFTENPFDPITEPEDYEAWVAELLYLTSAKRIKGVAGVDPDDYVVKSQLEGLGSGGGGSTPYLTDLDTWPTLKFDKNYRYVHEMAGPVTILAELVTPLAVVGNLCKLYIKADGTNKPGFQDGKFEVIWDNWVNTAGHWNRFYAEYSPEGKIILQIEQAHLGTPNDGTGLTQLTVTFEDNHVQSHIITNSTEIVIDSTGAQVGYKTIIYVKADGTNKPFWSSADVVVTYDDYLNEADVWNRIILEWRPESKAIMQLINT